MARTIEPEGVIVEAFAACSYPGCVEHRRYGSVATTQDEMEAVSKSFLAWLVNAGWKWAADGEGGSRLLCAEHARETENGDE